MGYELDAICDLFSFSLLWRMAIWCGFSYTLMSLSISILKLWMGAICLIKERYGCGFIIYVAGCFDCDGFD